MDDVTVPATEMDCVMAMIGIPIGDHENSPPVNRIGLHSYAREKAVLTVELTGVIALSQVAQRLQSLHVLTVARVHSD